MKLGKRLNSKREITGEITSQGFKLGTLAIATAIVVLVPVVLDADALMSTPANAYFPFKFKVLMGLSVALLVTVLGTIAMRREPLGVPVLIPALAFLGISALSALFSGNTAYSLFGDRSHGLLTLAAGVLLFYALAKVLDSPLRVRVFLAAGVITAVLISVFGISQKYGLDPVSGWRLQWYTSLPSIFSTLGNPLFLAAYLTLMMGAATALCFEAGSSGKYRAPWLCALAIIGACWIYADQRGPMLGVMLALPVVLWFSRRRMGTIRPLVAPIVTLVGAMAAALAASAAFGNLSLSIRTMTVLAVYLALLVTVLWLSQRGTRALRVSLVSLAILVVVGLAVVAVVTRSGNSALPERPAISSVGDPTSQIRLYTWRDALPMILDRPLLGHGPDNFEEPFTPYVSEELEVAIPAAGGDTSPMDNAHNEFIQVAATTGLLGLAAYVWVFVSYFRNVYRRGGWPLIALAGGVLAYILQLQTLFSTIGTSVIFWGILGASVGVMRVHDRQRSVEPTAKTPPPEAGGGGGGPSAQTPPLRGRLYESLVVVVVVGVVAAIAIPTFLDQRERAAQLERDAVMFGVRQTVLIYQHAEAQGEPYPEAGVYSRKPREDGRIGGGGIYVYYPARTVKITTTTPPTGEFTVEGESTTLSGTFTYSYDSATDTYSAPP